MADGVIPTRRDRLHEALVEVSSGLVDRHVTAADGVARELTFSQLGVVDRISRYGQVTVSSIAEHAGVAVSTASRWVDRLEALGLASREPAEDNRREVGVTLSALGEAVAERWDAARVAIWTDLLDGVDDTMAETVIGSMRTAVGAPPRSDTRGETSHESAVTSAPTSARLVVELVRALAGSSPDDIAATLVTAVSAQLDCDVTLRVVTHDGRHLAVVAHARRRDTEGASYDEEVASDETVDRSRPGDAFRSATPVVDHDGPWAVHVPITTATHRVGVVTLARDAEFAGDPAVLEQAALVAAAVAPYLATPKSATRSGELASRSRPWTIGAEIQSRQLGPPRVVAHGLVIAARIEPAFNTCTDSYDIEIITTDGRPAVDIAVLDSNVDRYSAPLVTGLALGALRHARAQERGLVEQARLLDEATFGHFRGQATVDFLLVRIDCDSRTCEVVATAGGIDVVHHASSVQRLEVARSDRAGLTGGGEYSSTRLAFAAGERIGILGDGFAADSATGRRAEVIMSRSRARSADEVVREIGIDLLDRTGVDGPPDDATVIVVDL